MSMSAIIGYIFAVLAGIAVVLFIWYVIRIFTGKCLYDRFSDEKLYFILGLFFFSASIATIILLPKYFDVPVAHSLSEFYYLSHTSYRYAVKLACIGWIPIGALFMFKSYLGWAKYK